MTPWRGPRRWLVMMAKEPRAGAVKTRLAGDIGAVRAAAFYRNSLSHVTARLAHDPRWHMLTAVTPDTAIGSSRWREHCDLIPQGTGDLGARMQRVFDLLPPGPVVIIGSDIPQITAPRVAAAFAALGPHDAVIGPCGDGGYWLVGLRRVPRTCAIFANVRWSSPKTLDDTLANLSGARIARLEALEDVDTGKDHRRLGAAGGRLVLPCAWRPGPAYRSS